MGQFDLKENSEKQQRIETLARTLKLSGFASSDVQAKRMAEEMLGVEDKVQKRYEEMNKAPARPMGYNKPPAQEQGPYFSRPSAVQDMHVPAEPQKEQQPKPSAMPFQQQDSQQPTPQQQAQQPSQVQEQNTFRSPLRINIQKDAESIDSFDQDKPLSELMENSSELEEANLRQPGDPVVAHQVPRPELDLFEDSDMAKEKLVIPKEEPAQAHENPIPQQSEASAQPEEQPQDHPKKKEQKQAEVEVDISEIFNFGNR